jgi:hypothetical protein
VTFVSVGTIAGLSGAENIFQPATSPSVLSRTNRLILQTDRIVEYETPPHAEGLGTTNTRLKAGDGPIDGIAILEGKTTDLRMLRVRLPREQRDLAHAIIQELLVRQRRDAR